jgi:hypothetical protein
MQRNVEADRLSCLEIDDKFELDWRLHWELGWLLALENAIQIRRRTPKIISPVNAVGQQAANFSALAPVLSVAKKERPLKAVGACRA